MKKYYYDFGDDEFEYEPEIDELKDAIINEVTSGCGIKIYKRSESKTDVEKVIDFFVENLDILDRLEEELYDELRVQFEEKARESYETSLFEKVDREDWYGTKNNVLGL